MQPTNGRLESVDRPARLRRDMIPRRRLMSVMAQRFDKRLTIVRAGPGFGKTTLLAQALRENDLDSRGEDVWIDLAVCGSDSAAILELVAARLGVLSESPSFDDVVNGVWRRAPRQVALVFDNVHAIASAGDAGAVFEQLTASLPANGHLVVCSRSEPPFAYDHLVTAGDAAVLGEVDLAFGEPDVAAFARSRNVRPGALGATGWAALLELRATVGSPGERDELVERILAALGPGRLQPLQRLALLGRFDDALVGAVTDFDGSADRLVGTLPLTSRRDSGEIVLHDLWRGWLPPLPDAAAVGARRSLGDALRARGDVQAAFSQYVEADCLGPAAEILRDVAIDYGLQKSLTTRRALLASVPPALASSAAAKLIETDVALVAQPSAAAGPTSDARLAARRLGDAELEAHALLRLAELAHRRRDIETVRGVHVDLERLTAQAPGPVAAMKGIVEIWLALSSDRLDEAAEITNGSAMTDYPPTAAHAGYFSALVASNAGHATRALRHLQDAHAQLHGRHAARARWLESSLHFQLGQMDETRRAELVGFIETFRVEGDSHPFVEGSATAAIHYLSAGDTERAVELILGASRANDSLPQRACGRVMMTLAQAALVVYEGDDKTAADLIETVLPDGGPFDALDRHVFNSVAALTYALVPRARRHWDSADCGEDHALARDVGRALVALRERSDVEPARGLPWHDIDRLRTWAMEPHLAELAVAACIAGEARAEAALVSLRHNPHRALARVAERHSGSIADKAVSLLAKTPRRPALPVRIEVLGPMRVQVGETSLPAARIRGRVVDFLQILIDERRVSRAKVLETLWPGLDGDRARNNMRVNLTHLLKLLEPERAKTAPPWFVRSDGDVITLHPSTYLELDVDEFEQAVRQADLDDRACRPGAALEGYLRACGLYVGDYLLESAAGSVGREHRDRVRSMFFGAATRSAQLLAADGRASEAASLAQRAVAAEPLIERGHVALIGALRTAGRDADADAAASRCRRVFHDAGRAPSGELARLLA